MAQGFVAKISSLFSSKPTRPGRALDLVDTPEECFNLIRECQERVDTPEEFFNLIRKCQERVEKMSFSSASSLKFNYSQCRYLSRKLSLAVNGARLILHSWRLIEKEILSVEAFNFERRNQTSIKEKVIALLDSLKMLYALAMEVEDIIKSCSRDAWILAAMTLTDVSEHVSSIGFDLELWRFPFYENKTLADIESSFRSEVEAVKRHASIDKETLRGVLFALLQRAKLSSTEYERASLLLERLERSRLVPSGDLAGTSQSSLSEKVIRSMKEMERLGKGAAATVFKAEWLGAEFAKKIFYGPSFPDFEKEVAVLTRLSHSNIASLLCYAKDKRECSIAMELMDGDLFSLMQQRLRGDTTRDSPFGILEAIDIMHQIGEGMRYMHEMRIVHRDLKSLNVLVKCVKAVESEVEYVQVKVADFGMSRTKERSMTYSSQSVNVGTTRWMAPELIRCSDSESRMDGEALIVQYPFKCDVYSFGMVCYEILSGDIPFSSICSRSIVKNMVMNGEHPKLPAHCPRLLKNLIERCWSQDASERPSFGEICVDMRYLKYMLLSTMPWPSSMESAMTLNEKIPSSMLAFLKDRINSRLLDISSPGGTMFPVRLEDDLVVGIKCAHKSQECFGRFRKYGELETLLETLGSILHRNLVRLMAYVCITDYHVLVYEFILGCTLEETLADRKCILTWPERRRILCDVARGLEYLHTGVSPSSSIVHRQLTPSNILLTEGTYKSAMITGVGSATIVHHNTATGDVFDDLFVCPTGYYLAPECSEKRFSSKSDVFSFGVVMAQLVTGRDPSDRCMVANWGSIGQWLHICVELGRGAVVAVDLTLRNSEYKAEILRAMKIAVLCTHEDPEQRPESSEVFTMLEQIQNPEQRPQSRVVFPVLDQIQNPDIYVEDNKLFNNELIFTIDPR